MSSSQYGHAPIVKQLLEHGAHSDSQSKVRAKNACTTSYKESKDVSFDVLLYIQDVIHFQATENVIDN